MKQPVMKTILPEKKWSSSESLSILETLSPRSRNDLCIISLDARRDEPEVLEVLTDVFRNRHRVSLPAKNMSEFKGILGTLEAISDPDFMECIRQSKIDKKHGRFRKFDDIACECGI